MAQEYETLREVGIAIEGVGTQLGFHAKVFVGVVTVAIAAIGFLGNQVWTMNGSISRIDERTVSMDARLSRIESLLENIDKNTKQASLDLGDLRANLSFGPVAMVPEPESDTFSGWIGVPVPTAAEASNVFEKFKVETGFTQPAWLFVPEEKPKQ